MKNLITILLLFTLVATGVQAQQQNDTAAVNDSTPTLSKKELRKLKKANRNFHYNILGGPSYSPDFGLLVGGSALMTFSLNPQDTTLKRSVVPIALAFMFDGGINIFSKPQLFFKHDRFRLFGKFSYKTRWKIITISAIRPTETTFEATQPANTDTAAYKSIPGFCSDWAKAISSQVHRLTSTTIISPNLLKAW